MISFAIWSFSCTPTRSIVLDIPQSARKELPLSVQSLTLVSQAVNDKFTDLHQDSLQKKFYQKRFNLDTVLFDFQMADTTLKALGELLFESGRYDYVIPENRFLDPPLNPATELSWEVASALTETFETDAVLSLDHLRTRVITNYKNETQYNAFQGGFNTIVVANMRIQYEALFRVYLPQEKRILLREFIRDTLMWEDADVTAGGLFSRFTPVKQALTEAGIAIALDLSDKIAVRWRPERRRYFTSGNTGLKQGNQSAIEGNWEKAVAYWKEAAEKSRSKSSKSKSLLNVALGYEILGDIDSAISWALKSYETMYRPLTYEYLEILKRRKNEIRKE
jgi:tetratricopeptide (TPR) repeat protein